MDDIPAVWPGTKEEVDMLTLGVTKEYICRSQARKKFFDDPTTICTANFRTNPNYPSYHTVRKVGFHVANVLYGACVPPGFDTTAAASGITAQQESEHMNCLAGFSLSPKQTAFCRSVFFSNTGMTLGRGHGGKGALLSTVATIVGMLQLGKKVLVCGPTNRSIKAIVEGFLEPSAKAKVKAKVKAVTFGHWAIYTGGYAKKGLKIALQQKPRQAARERKASISIDFRITNVYDAEALTTRSVGAATASLEFPPGDMEHLRDNGQDYDDLLAQGRSSDGLDWQGRADLEMKEAWWHRYLLGTGMRLIFCTTAMAGEEDLQAFFKADVVVVDDASALTKAELAVPVAGFKESAESVVLVGDHETSCLCWFLGRRTMLVMGLAASLFKSHADPEVAGVARRKDELVEVHDLDG
nr:hypothetical protein B0A51_16718 [Rachicladosporium sp. CCFEE 5018]